MNRTFLKAAAVMALALIAGAAFAQPDITAAVWQAFTGHADVIGGASLAWSAVVRDLQAKQTASVDAAKGIVAKANAEGRDLNEAEQADFDKHKADAESFKTRIERQQQVELMEAGLSRGEAAAAAAQTALPSDGGRSVTLAASQILATRENVEADPQRGFRHVGDYARSLVHAAGAMRRGEAIDKRLLGLMGEGFNAAAPSTYANESVGVDGGYLVPPAYSQVIFGLSLEEDALLPRTDNTPVEGNGMSFPKDETTPWGSNGIRAYWQGEAAAGTPTKPVLGTTDLKLKKLMALVPVTNELIADATALNAYIPKNTARSIRWKSDEALLFGNGAGQPLGAFSGGAHIDVAIESSGNTGVLLPMNLAKMIARLMPGSYSRAFWMVNNDVLPFLFTLTLGNYPIYLPAGAPVGGIQGSPYGSLLGRPIVVSQHCKSFGTLGDILLTDMSYYQAITKSEGVSMATSMHLYFDADAIAFRATFRVDGMPKMAAPVTPANGSNTLSPFVRLAAR